MDAKMDAAVRVIVKERNRKRRAAAENRDRQYLYEWASAYADGLDLALSAVAGAYGYGWRESLEAALVAPAVDAPTTHHVHNDHPDDGDPTRPGRYCGPGCDLYEDPDPFADCTCGAIASPSCPVHGEADPQPMGGWEPRS